jgi:hypothetical protein
LREGGANAIDQATGGEAPDAGAPKPKDRETRLGSPTPQQRGQTDGSATLVIATNSITHRTLADRAADVVNVRDFGAKGDGIADDTAAIQSAIAAGRSSGKAVEIHAGTYSLSPLTLLGSTASGLTIRGIGQVVLLFSAGTAGLTLGDAGHTDGVYNLTLDNLEIQGAGYLTYGLRLLFAVNLESRHLRVNDGTHIGTGIYTDYSWDNNFFGTLLLTKSNGVDFGTNNANRHAFYGGRFESTFLDGTGVRPHGYANALYGVDVSSFKRGFVIGGVQGLTISGCYFEGNAVADLVFDGRTLSVGEPEGVAITGSAFLGTGAPVAIQESMSGGDRAWAVDISANSFRNYATGISLSQYATDWKVGPNRYNSVTTPVAGAPARSLIQDSGRYRHGTSSRFQVFKSEVTGTMVIDSVAKFTPSGVPAFVKVACISQDGLNALEFLAVISDAGILASSSILYNTSGATAIQVSGGNLQVTTMNLGNYLCTARVESYAAMVDP